MSKQQKQGKQVLIVVCNIAAVVTGYVFSEQILGIFG